MGAIVCPKCGRLTEENAPACFHCGARLGRTFRLERSLGRLLGSAEVTRVLLFTIVLIYLFQGGLSAMQESAGELFGREGGGLADFFRQDVEILYALGLQSTWAITERGEWWRLVTSIFTHLGLLHLAFNGIALYYVGFAMEEVFGAARTLLIFFGAGLGGSLASLLFAIDGAGASGALFGFIGALAWFGYRRGGVTGREIKRKMLFWAAYGMIFGFLVRANNVAHGAGFLAGGLMAMLVGWEPRRLARSRSILAAAMVLLFALSWTLAVVHYRGNVTEFKNELIRDHRR